MKKVIMLVVCFIIFGFVYKLVLLNKYHVDEVSFNNDGVFKDTITINHKVTEEKIYEYDGILVKDDFSDFDMNDDFFISRNTNNEVIAAISFNRMEQYYKLLHDSNFIMNDEKHSDELFTSFDQARFLTNNNINNDIDLFNYVKKNYYLKSNIFSSIKTLKENYIINMFVSTTLITNDQGDPSTITLINGDLDGYIINVNDHIKEIHLLHDDEQYTIILVGKAFINDEYVTSLLESVEYE